MFTYFQLINVCSSYKFVDILMIEIMKLVGGKSEIYYNKGFQSKPGDKAFDKNVPSLPG